MSEVFDDENEEVEEEEEAPEPFDDSELIVEDRLPSIASEPLFSNLLQAAIAKIAPDDVVLAEYAREVVPQISRLLGHVSAKGGNFVIEKQLDGTSAKDVARYSADQSMRAHLINGLLPAAQIARTLLRWGQPRFVNFFDETTYRLFCAGFTMHDWLKLPSVEQQLAEHGLSHSTVNLAVDFEVVKTIVGEWCKTLGLDRFLAPIGTLEQWLPDL